MHGAICVIPEPGARGRSYWCNELERNPQSRSDSAVFALYHRRRSVERGVDRSGVEGAEGEARERGSILRGRKSSNAELARKVLAHARFIRRRAARGRDRFRGRNDRGGYIIAARLAAPFFSPLFPPLADILLTFDRDTWGGGKGESVVKRFVPARSVKEVR